MTNIFVNFLEYISQCNSEHVLYVTKDNINSKKVYQLGKDILLKSDSVESIEYCSQWLAHIKFFIANTKIVTDAQLELIGKLFPNLEGLLIHFLPKKCTSNDFSNLKYLKIYTNDTPLFGAHEFELPNLTELVVKGNVYFRSCILKCPRLNTLVCLHQNLAYFLNSLPKDVFLTKLVIYFETPISLNMIKFLKNAFKKQSYIEELHLLNLHFVSFCSLCNYIFYSYTFYILLTFLGLLE